MLLNRERGALVKRILAVLLLFLVAPSLLQAQETGARIEKRFEKLPEPKSTLQPFAFPVSNAVTPAVARTIRLTLHALKFSGNTAFSSEELNKHCAPLLGKEITLYDLYLVRDAITAQYGAAGFGLSRAVVPEQRIQADGVFLMEIIEGYVDDVVVKGGSEAQKSYLEYAARQIKAERPVRAATVDRYLLLANDRFAVKVKSMMQPSETNHGASTLIMTVEDSKLLDAGVSVDNRGTKSVGPTQINSNIGVNGLGGRASQTSVAYSTVEQLKELQYASITHTEIVTNEGTALSVSYTTSDSRPGTTTLQTTETKSNSNSWSAKIAHPLIRTHQQNLTASIKYDQKDTTSKTLGETTSSDKIRSVRAGLNYDYTDAYQGINQVIVEYSHGIEGLGSSTHSNDVKSRSDARYDYSKATVNVSRTQEIPPVVALDPDHVFLGFLVFGKYSVVFSAGGQMAETGLLSSEEFGIGGQQYGRAYDSSEILGDTGYAGSVEFRFVPDTENAFFKTTSFYAFYDAGQTYNFHPLSESDSRSKSLSSAGVGVRFGVTQYMNGSLEYALPLSRVVANEGNGNGRFFGSLSARF